MTEMQIQLCCTHMTMCNFDTTHRPFNIPVRVLFLRKDFCSLFVWGVFVRFEVWHWPQCIVNQTLNLNTYLEAIHTGYRCTKEMCQHAFTTTARLYYKCTSPKNLKIIQASVNCVKVLTLQEVQVWDVNPAFFSLNVTEVFLLSEFVELSCD